MKALANQIKIQSTGARHAGRAEAKSGKVKSDLPALDEQLKTGDAKKAEAALAAVRKDLNTVQQTATAHPRKHPEEGNASFQGLDTYA